MILERHKVEAPIQEHTNAHDDIVPTRAGYVPRTRIQQHHHVPINDWDVEMGNRAWLGW